MPAIPKTQQYYPSVPLSELGDLYSKGDNRLGAEKICIISFLPKTLRISENLPFNNKYVLYIENTENVTSIDWGYELFNNGESVNLDLFLEETPSVNDAEYLILFYGSSVDLGGQPSVDKLVVTCTIRNGAEETVLSVEHSFVKSLNSTGLVTADETKKQTLAFSGDPNPTNYVLNHLKDFLQESTFTWNNNIVEIDLSGESTLLKIISAILYYNVEVLSNNSPVFPFFFNINEYKSVGMENYLNDAIPYEGNYVNGIFQIPIHILSDVLTNVAEVPDFTEIDEGNGNPIFNIMRDAGLMTYNDLLGDELRTVPQQIQDSKLRIKNNEDKFIDLFNLTLFPKSAIKLTAILVKYLFESSKLNNCDECLHRSPIWPTTTLDGLKNYPYFLRNILTHYFREPTNNIESYSQAAIKTTSLVWSPAVYLITNVDPRIVKAYFARKLVRQIGVDGATPILAFDFERIDSEAIRVDENGVRRANQPDFDSILGGQLYLIVETLHCRNKELTLNIRPTSNDLSGDQNSLDLLVGTQNLYQSDISKAVGNYDDLRNNINDVFSALNIECFNVDHKDKAIIKLRLKPNTTAAFATHLLAFNDWAARLAAQTVNLQIVVRFSDAAYAIFGNDVISRSVEGEFVNNNDAYRRSNFRVVNRILYEVYHEDNRWNFLPIVGAARQRIGSIDNQFTKSIPDGSPDIGFRKVHYFYYDSIGSEHLIGENISLYQGLNYFRPRARANGVTISNNSNPVNIPPGWTSDAAAPLGGDAFRNYYYPNDDIVTRDNPAAGGTDYGIKRYPVGAGFAELVQMPDHLDIVFTVNNNEKRIVYTFSNTQRRFANVSCFAAFIGVLAQLNYNNVRSTGMCFRDATSYPSVSHPNGDSIDTIYLETQVKRHAIIDAFREWGFTQIISGTNAIHNGDGADLHNAAHNNHLHSGNFNGAGLITDLSSL